MMMISVLFFLHLLCLCDVHADVYDCCLPSLTATGLGCIIDTTVGNDTYTCVRINSECQYCNLVSTINSTSCTACCLTDSSLCEYEEVDDTVTFTTTGK